MSWFSDVVNVVRVARLLLGLTEEVRKPIQDLIESHARDEKAARSGVASGEAGNNAAKTAGPPWACLHCGHVRGRRAVQLVGPCQDGHWYAPIRGAPK